MHWRLLLEQAALPAAVAWIDNAAIRSGPSTCYPVAGALAYRGSTPRSVLLGQRQRCDQHQEQHGHQQHLECVDARIKVRFTAKWIVAHGRLSIPANITSAVRDQTGASTA